MLGWCFFFNDTATTEIYTLSLHDALPISPSAARLPGTSRTVSWAALGPVAAAALFALMATVTWLQVGLGPAAWERLVQIGRAHVLTPRHANISYAVLFLEKTKQAAA